MSALSARPLRAAADVGGTFTDVAVFDESTGALRLGKTLSTPSRLMDGILTGSTEAAAEWSETNLFLHGSTVAINTMLERTGARVALVTTRGFRDIYEIGRINRPDSFNLFFKKHVPLVERALRFEIDERLRADGSIYRPLGMNSVKIVADRIAEEGVAAIAIMLLHSYRNPSHEKAVKAYLASRFPDLFITASHEICQEYREFERTSTVVANAYVGPKVRAYVGEIETILATRNFAGQFMVVQSTGGLYTSADARANCVRMLESGPAAGVIGTQALCNQIGVRNAISFDMGGTTAKSGVVLDGRVLTTGQAMIGGYNEGLPLLTEMVDIHEVGTGGGSIARVSPSGALGIGPQSAGAMPGPACYGRGGLYATVTDANLLLGRLSAEQFLGGQMRLDRGAAERAIDREVARPLELSLHAAASGILRIAASNMSHAVRGVTTDRGLDIGQFPALVAFGGAGPLHATMVARELRIGTVIVPFAPGHFSAFGMLLSDFRYDFARSQFVRLSDVAFEALESQLAELEAEGIAAVSRANLSTKQVLQSRSMDMRYVGQEHAVTVGIASSLFQAKDKFGIKQVFDTMHRQRYGRESPHEEAEIVSIRVTVTGVLAKPKLARVPAGRERPEAAAVAGSRRAYFEGAAGWVENCPVFRRDRLLANNHIKGPALIEEHASTTVLWPGDSLEVDNIGNLVIQVGRN